MANVPIEEMRLAVANAYPGEKWKRKVTYMYDNQIIALYHRFYDSEEEKPVEPIPEPPKFKPYEGEQIRFNGLG